MKVFVLGLRRSGTTAVWRTIKQDKRFHPYNEPFNPLIRGIGETQWFNEHRKYYHEYYQLMKRDGVVFWDKFSAIHELEELQTGFSDRQRSYLEYLLSERDDVLLEETRCHFKVEDLAAVGGDDSVLVHLYRSPESFATSHLVPSGQQIRSTDSRFPRKQVLLARNEAAKVFLRLGFWNRRSDYDNWGIERLVGETSSGLFAKRLQEVGIEPSVVYGLPAVARLMSYWKVCFERIETDGIRLFGNRFLSLPFSDFCNQPQQSLARLYSVMGISPPQFDVSFIHPPNGPYQPWNGKWMRYRRMLNIGEQ